MYKLENTVRIEHYRVTKWPWSILYQSKVKTIYYYCKLIKLNSIDTIIMEIWILTILNYTQLHTVPAGFNGKYLSANSYFKIYFMIYRNWTVTWILPVFRMSYKIDFIVTFINHKNLYFHRVGTWFFWFWFTCNFCTFWKVRKPCKSSK